MQELGFVHCNGVGLWREKERKEPRNGRGKEEMWVQAGSMEGKGEEGAEEWEGEGRSLGAGWVYEIKVRV